MKTLNGFLIRLTSGLCIHQDLALFVLVLYSFSCIFTGFPVEKVLVISENGLGLPFQVHRVFMKRKVRQDANINCGGLELSKTFSFYLYFMKILVFPTHHTSWANDYSIFFFNY